MDISQRLPRFGFPHRLTLDLNHKNCPENDLFDQCQYAREEVTRGKKKGNSYPDNNYCEIIPPERNTFDPSSRKSHEQRQSGNRDQTRAGYQFAIDQPEGVNGVYLHHCVN